MDTHSQFFRSSRRLLGRSGLSLTGVVVMVAAFASPALPRSGAVTYAPPDMSDVSAAELGNYYAWRQHMDWLLAPIHTRADLEKYLKATATSGSPLDALAPDARRRLLSNIQFGPSGAFVTSTADLQYLSTEQVYKILALFGEQGLALRFTGGKIRPASPRPKSTSTQESLVQRRFDEYWEATQSAPESWQKQGKVFADKYDQLFSPLQNPAEIRTLPSGDLRLLFRAACQAAFATADARYAHDAHMDFAEMERRHFAGWPDYDGMYQSLVLTRQFAAARQFWLAYPDADLTPFPEYRDEAGKAGEDTPTVLTVSATKDTLVRRPVNLDQPAQVLILTDPGCHFCADFDRALQSHPKLRAVIERHAIWVTPPGSELEFDTLQQWNKTHQNMPLTIMYDLKGWSMVKVIATPQFFFLQHGKLIAKHRGWRGNEDFAALESGLKAIGLWH